MASDRVDQELEQDHEQQRREHQNLNRRFMEEAERKVAGAADKGNHQEEAGAVAQRMQDQAYDDLAEQQDRQQRGRWVRRGLQIINLLFGLIYALISIQIVLELIGARDWSGFKKFMDTITGPILAPFRNLVTNPGSGDYQLMVSWILALVVYALLHWGIKQVLRVIAD